MLKTWCIGDNDVIIFNTDGTWQREDYNDKSTFRSIHADKQLASLWIVDHFGTILSKSITTKHWETFVVDTNARLLDIYMLSPQFGFIIGANGLLLRTTNGKDWTRLETNTLACLRTIYFTNENHGWIGGDAGTLLSTNDGNSWIKHNIQTPECITKIKFLDANIGWLCGTNGLIRKTTDGGKTWIAQYTETSDEVVIDKNKQRIVIQRESIMPLQCQNLSLTDIIPLSEMSAIVSTNNGLFVTHATNSDYKNSGTVWTPIEIKTISKKTSKFAIKSLAMKDNIGVAVGKNGFIAISKDSGKTWQKESIMVTTETLRSVCVVEV